MSAYKLCFVGCVGVGKSTLAARVWNGKYVPNLPMTRAVQIDAITRMYQEQSFHLVLWDCTSISSMVPPLTKEADVVFLMVDATRFERTAQYLRELDPIASTVKILVVNKIDAVSEASRPTPAMIAELASDLGCVNPCEVSAKTGAGMEAFLAVGMQAVASCNQRRQEEKREACLSTLEAKAASRPPALLANMRAFFERRQPQASGAVRFRPRACGEKAGDIEMRLFHAGIRSA